ncbi:unnamed protein product [Nesidiocoris tenuis]|uniref:Uncharacterized protein n=1 Tax=Nesidiocoris tenuis TaxID=355587 RepID=A0A6H5H5Y0_9HEMI|nr:unnamed protein product [Nesidiocoris tenuis]
MSNSPQNRCFTSEPRFYRMFNQFFHFFSSPTPLPRKHEHSDRLDRPIAINFEMGSSTGKFPVKTCPTFVGEYGESLRRRKGRSNRTCFPGIILRAILAKNAKFASQADTRCVKEHQINYVIYWKIISVS